MKENEEPLDYFYRMLVEKKIKFSDLVHLYVNYLEHENKEQWRDIVEANTLLVGVKETTLWSGSKKSYQDRVKAFLNKFKLY